MGSSLSVPLGRVELFSFCVVFFVSVPVCVCVYIGLWFCYQCLSLVVSDLCWRLRLFDGLGFVFGLVFASTVLWWSGSVSWPVLVWRVGVLSLLVLDLCCICACLVVSLCF